MVAKLLQAGTLDLRDGWSCHRITEDIWLEETSKIIQSNPWFSTGRSTLNHAPQCQVHMLLNCRGSASNTAQGRPFQVAELLLLSSASVGEEEVKLLFYASPCFMFPVALYVKMWWCAGWICIVDRISSLLWVEELQAMLYLWSLEQRLVL